MKKSVVLALALLLTSSLFAATVTVEGFENPADFTALGLNSYSRTGDTATLTSVAGKTGNGLKVDLHVNAAADPWYLPTRFQKIFTTPVDLSSAEYLSIDVKMLNTNDQFMMGLHIEDIYGAVSQVDYYPCNNNTPNAFITYTFALNDLKRAVWHGKNALDLTKIAKIYFRIENSGSVPANTDVSYILDNLKYYTKGTSSALQETVVDNFNYASVDALTTNWKNKFGSRPLDAIALLDDGNSGKKLKMTKAFTGANAQSGLELTLATPIDLTDAEYFKFDFAGDSAFAASANNAYFAVYIGDTAGNYASGLVWGSPTSSTSGVVYFPFVSDGINYPSTAWGTTPWALDPWGQIIDWKEFQYWRAPGTDYTVRTNVTAINKIVIAFTPTGAAATGSVTIDNLVYGKAMNAMPKPSNRTYNVHKINVGSTPVIDGNDSEWTPYPASEDFVYVTKSNTVPSTEQEYFKAAYDDNYLYVMMKAVKPNWALGYTLTGGPRDPGGVAFDATHEEFGIFWSPLGVDQAAQQYHTIFVPTTTGQMYIWDEINWGGASSWDATGDAAAYTKVGNVVTVEYKIPFTIFDKAEQGIVTAAPTAGSVWGVQVIQTPVNESDIQWEPNGAWSQGRPFGSFVFTGTSSVSDWSAMAE